MGCKMKKYVVLFLMCLPMVSFGAPSVRALGAGAVVGASGATASKITPAKVGSTPSTSSVARVGSLRAKATTVGTPSAVSGATGRFPVISTAKVYNTTATPRPISSVSNASIINTEENLDALTQRVTDIEDLRGNTNVVKMSNLEGSTNIVNTVKDNKDSIEELNKNADTVLVSGSGNPFTGNPQNENRAWIWVEK